MIDASSQEKIAVAETGMEGLLYAMKCLHQLKYLKDKYSSPNLS